MFGKNVTLTVLVLLVFLPKIGAGVAHSFDFDYIDKSTVALDMVLEIENGLVTYNVNETPGEGAETKIPFPYIVNNYQIPHVNSLIFLNERGDIIFKDVALSGTFYPTTYFPAGDGSAYLTIEGVCRPTGGDFLNAYPDTKKLYSSEGRVIWEKRAEGYPRVSPNGDYVAVFFASGFEGRITLINKNGNTSEVEGPVGPFHAISKEGDFLLVGEPTSVPSDWRGGTTIYSATGELITHLDPNFACRSAVHLEGDLNIYGSRKIIVQTGFFIKRENVVEAHGNSYTITDGLSSERGIQVYDGKGKKLWERKLGKGHPGLRFFVSDNEEYIALIPDLAAGITVFKSATGGIIRRIKTSKFPYTINGGYISNDGNIIFLTYQCGVKSGDYDTGAVILSGGRVVAEIRLSVLAYGKFSGNLTPDADMLLLNSSRRATVYKLRFKK
jgi:hypothetical protein